MTDIEFQEDEQAPSSGGTRRWENKSAKGSDVASTMSISTIMTAAQFKKAKGISSAEPDGPVAAEIPESVLSRYRNRRSKTQDPMAGLTPSASCLQETYLRSRYPKGDHDSTSKYYPSLSEGSSMPLIQACDGIATGVSQKAETITVKSSVKAGGTAYVARSLYDEKKNLAMTFGLKLSLGNKSGPSTQASTVSSVRARNKGVTQESDNEEDADGMTDDDEYDRICETDAKDANRASDEEDYDKYGRRPGV